MECTYDTLHKKCLSLALTIFLFRPHIERAQFEILTNNVALCWILNLANAFGNLTCWPLLPPEFEFDVVHRAFINHQGADTLFQLSTNWNDITKLNDALPVRSVVAAIKYKDVKFKGSECHILCTALDKTK